ncbi:amidohydrolase family protein [Rhodopseudomonas sp.]|uniref:metal-dependent hydrolase family protein n=1 Tax=Rhodopseudomonas sp. TaxID=1078 RepID=UPI0039E2A9B5
MLAQQGEKPLLLRGAKIFDGVAARPIEGRELLIVGGTIADLVRAGQAVADATVVDCKGTTLIPGLIDAHWHALMVAIPEIVAMTADVPYIHLVAAQEAQRTLLRGFTTVRDVGGPAFALKRSIDEGRFPGPRIYPSGAMISQTSGHGDFRMRGDLPRSPQTNLSAAENAGIAMIADGEAEVLRRVREQLMLGASQIKIMAGGGVSSHFDPLDSLQYSEAEMRAAVGAAADWGTYVCAHVYTSTGIRRALAAGVRSIEHGQLADEDTVRMMADAGAWWSIQPFLDDEDSNPKSDPVQRAQQQEIAQGTARAFELGRKHKVKMAFGTDILFSPRGTASQGRQLAKLARWYEPAEVLRMATGRAGELMAMSGARNPYPGRLGVLEKGALADVIAVAGDPLADIGLIGDPDRNFRLIVKAGRIHKNTLAA